MKKSIWGYVGALLVGIYTSFVAMCMWNWFVATAFNVSTISFLQMLGIVWLIALLTNRSTSDENRWKMLFMIVDACVPEGKRQSLMEAIDSEKEHMWVDLSLEMFGQVMVNTVILILGFGLHCLI